MTVMTVEPWWMTQAACDERWVTDEDVERIARHLRHANMTAEQVAAEAAVRAEYLRAARSTATMIGRERG